MEFSNGKVPNTIKLVLKGKEMKKTVKSRPKQPVDLSDKLHRILEENLQYSSFIEYDYSRSRCTGHCDDYCRCTQILGARVTKIDTRGFIDNICENLFRKTETIENIDINILKYCTERLLSYSELNNLFNYSIDTCSGYYGEEIHGIKISNIDTLYTDFANLLKCKTNIDLIKFILKMEYGYLIPIVEKATKATIVTAQLKLIQVPNGDYTYRQLDNKIIKSYRDHHKKYPIGIYRCNGWTDIIMDHLEIVDGWHRYSAALASGAKECQVIVFTSEKHFLSKEMDILVLQ
jgi:hypothetical protein